MAPKKNVYCPGGIQNSSVNVCWRAFADQRWVDNHPTLVKTLITAKLADDIKKVWDDRKLGTTQAFKLVNNLKVGLIRIHAKKTQLLEKDTENLCVQLYNVDIEKKPPKANRAPKKQEVFETDVELIPEDKVIALLKKGIQDEKIITLTEEPVEMCLQPLNGEEGFGEGSEGEENDTMIEFRNVRAQMDLIPEEGALPDSTNIFLENEQNAAGEAVADLPNQAAEPNGEVARKKRKYKKRRRTDSGRRSYRPRQRRARPNNTNQDETVRELDGLSPGVSRILDATAMNATVAEQLRETLEPCGEGTLLLGANETIASPEVTDKTQETEASERTQPSLGDEPLSPTAQKQQEYLDKYWNPERVLEYIIQDEKESKDRINIESLVARHAKFDAAHIKMIKVTALVSLITLYSEDLVMIEKYPDSMYIYNVRVNRANDKSPKDKEPAKDD